MLLDFVCSYSCPINHHLDNENDNVLIILSKPINEAFIALMF